MKKPYSFMLIGGIFFALIASAALRYTNVDAASFRSVGPTAIGVGALVAKVEPRIVSERAHLIAEEAPVIETVEADALEEEPVREEPVIRTDVDYPYYIRINRYFNTVNVYGIAEDAEEGEYDVPYKAFVCSCGHGTPLGVYDVGEKHRWGYLFGNVWGQYTTRITGYILFHSVPYFSMDASDLEYEEYNKLGETASMGCVRLSVEDAKWIYDNCPYGTTVVIYEDMGEAGPLGKPVPKIIDVNDRERRGWDPTDPDPENPYLIERIGGVRVDRLSE